MDPKSKCMFLGAILLIFSLGFPVKSSAEIMANLPWSRMETSLFKPDWGYVVPDAAICASNELKVFSCFEFVIQKSCLQFYTYLILPESIPYVFDPDKVADMEIDNKLSDYLNTLLKHKRIVGDVVVKFSLSGALVWRIQLGNSETTRTAKEAMYYQLIHGEKLTYYIYTEGGPTLRSPISLEGLAPLLEESLKIVEEKYPEIKTC